MFTYLESSSGFFFFYLEWVRAELVIYLSLETDADVEMHEEKMSLSPFQCLFPIAVIIWECFAFCNSYPNV